MTETAVGPLQTALFAALGTIPMIITAGGPKVFEEGNVQRELGGVRVTLPWIVLAGSVEPDDERYYMQPGRAQEVQIKSWGNHRIEAFALHAEVMAKLDHQTLMLVGHRLVQMKLGHLADFKEQGSPADMPGPYGVIGRLRTLTVNA